MEDLRKIPVLVLAFNRADNVKKSLNAIRNYRPDKIYLACDGPRKNNKRDIAAVADTRQTMLDAIDWDCKVYTLFRNENLGCANGVNDAISWFFNHEEYGIVCEDDVVLGEDFFTLCELLLPRYAQEDKIMQISARNTSYRLDIDNSYVYSQCFHCWGWATWRRAWQKMDMSMSAMKTLKLEYVIKKLGFFRGCMMYKTFKNGYKNLDNFNSWATRWYLSILSRDALVICPGVNLAINIGLTEGTHFDEKDALRPGYDLKIGKMEFPIVYNDSLLPDKFQKIADSKFFFKTRMYGLKKKIKINHLNKPNTK